MIEERGKRKEERARSFIHPLRSFVLLPSVKLGSLTFMRHKMTFNHFSKDLIHPLSQRDKVSGDRVQMTEFHFAHQAKGVR